VLKLLFDPVTYQFYFRPPPDESTSAKTAGFSWDPVRRRYFTNDPRVAVALAKHGDTYVRRLLADVVEGDAMLANREEGQREQRLFQSSSDTLHRRGAALDGDAAAAGQQH
jgi:hypothetical protein